MIKIDNSKKGIITRVMTFLLLIMMALPFMTNTVNAGGFGEGEGGDPTLSDLGYWYVAEGPNAWDTFKSIQSSQRDWTWLINWINNNSLGYQYPDGSRESMEETCKRSQYIWWYADYNTGFMYIQTRGSNNIPQSHWKPMSNDAAESLAIYKNWSNLWSGGQVVIICSAAYDEPEPDPEPVKIVAKSGTYQYDGSYKTVEGIDYNKSDLSKLKPGHTAKATIKRSEKEVGAYPVGVRYAKIVDGSNRDVSKEYLISTEDGVLTITPPPPPDVKDTWRCVDHRSDSAKAYVLNTTSGSHGFTPAGAPSLNNTYGKRWTPAGDFAEQNSVPGPGDSLSSWNSWKSSFQNGSNTVTPDLNLESAGVSGVLSKYGGVYNIKRSLREDTYKSTNCQPQTRGLERKKGSSSYEVCSSTPTGGRKCSTRTYNYTYYEWTPWTNSGERIVWSSSGPSSNTEYYNYQLLSVNCNKDGFNSVKDEVGETVTVLSLADGDAGAVLQTPERSGKGPGPLGRGNHVTAKSSFYNDGNSCREAFTCTVDAPSFSVSNDANNNQGNTHLFTEYKESAEPDKKYGLPNDEGQLVFFRDNNDRQVRADVWYPKPTGKSDLESYSGDPAKRTWVKIYNNPEPTPEIELTKIAPWSDKNDTINHFFEKVYKGHHNRFLMKSQWTSDKGKPYQVGLKWEYKATGYNKVPKFVDGYKVKSMTDVKEYNFDIYCDFKNATGDYQANVPKTPFANGTTGREWSTDDAIRTLFTRSVSDMTN